MNSYEKNMAYLDELSERIDAISKGSITKSLGHKLDGKIKEFFRSKEQEKELLKCLEEYFS